jgi:hypothetical protein
MDEHQNAMLEQARRKLAEQEQAVKDTKKFINQLCQFAGEQPPYVIDDEKPLGAGLGAIQRDTFYGKSVITAVRELLEMRKASGLGAATHAEIIEALKTGGFDFDTLSSDTAVAQRAVSITLGKNSSIFHRLPNGNWGLLLWYPDAKEKKQRKRAEDTNKANGDTVTANPPQKDNEEES